MNNTISNFLKALNEVERIDYVTQRVTLVDDIININGDTFSTYENNFVTKLNEKYAVLNHIKFIEEPKELVRQFQVPKKYAYSDISDSRIEQSVNDICRILGDDANPIEELYLIPDFIIHKDESDKSPTNQRLIVEAKTELNLSYKKFIWDFFKLNLYLNKFHFQNAIFLSINTPQKAIYNHISNYLKDRLYLPEVYSRLYIITKENFESEADVISFQDFFDKQYRRNSQ